MGEDFLEFALPHFWSLEVSLQNIQMSTKCGLLLMRINFYKKEMSVVVVKNTSLFFYFNPTYN